MNTLLEGIRVIDLSRTLAAPFCSMILADLGAEVIKVENPDGGDDSRAYGPMINGKSGYFASINRGKKSVTLDLKKPESIEKLGKLLKNADVMLDNFRPGVLDRLGITEAWLKEINPELIVASVTGFGHTGPYREKAAYDMVVQGYSGIMSLTGEPENPPTRVGISLGDLAAGLYAAIGIVSSLYARTLSKKGNRLDISMLDCQVALLENSIVRYKATGDTPGRIGNRHPSITPFQMYKSKDGYIIICAGNEKTWTSLCDALKCPELADDPRFIGNVSRTANVEALYGLLNEALKEKTTAEWIDVLEEVGVPCGPVNDVAGIAENEQVKAREMVVGIDCPDMGRVYASGSPIKSSNYSLNIKDPAPALGENNDILDGLT